MSMQVEEVLTPIPDDQRVSTASYQFWIWCGANIAPINWILGTLGIAFWGMSMTDTILCSCWATPSAWGCSVSSC